MNHEKVNLRKKMKTILSKIDTHKNKIMSKLIHDQLIQYFFSNDSFLLKNCGCFDPMSLEPDLSFFYKELQNQGRVLFFPTPKRNKNLECKGEMEYIESNFDQLSFADFADDNQKSSALPKVSKSFDQFIKVPSKACRKVDEANEDVSSLDLLLIPGLAFNSRGERLGKGGGFFDRFLQNYRGIKVGVCFEEQIVKKIPVELHDQRVDYVVTEKNIIIIKNHNF